MTSLQPSSGAPITLEEAQWLGETIHRLSQLLEFAAQVGTSGDRRKAAEFALGSVVDFLQTCNFPHRHTAHLSQLFDALRDLEHGTVAPILAPGTVPQSRPIRPTA